jgi:hypothetical protein
MNHQMLKRGCLSLSQSDSLILQGLGSRGVLVPTSSLSLSMLPPTAPAPAPPASMPEDSFT